MNPVPQVTRCKVTGSTSVRLEFQDGFGCVLDLRPALCGPILESLKRPEAFRKVTIKDGTLVWPNGGDICPSVLRYWCELGRVCSQEELDSHFLQTASVKEVGAVAEAPVRYGRKR